MQVSGLHCGSVDPSLRRRCCPALATDVCALKLKSLVKTVSSQVSQATHNVQQSGEGDLAADMESALGGNGDFPDICGDAAEGEAPKSGSSPVRLSGGGHRLVRELNHSHFACDLLPLSSRQEAPCCMHGALSGQLHVEQIS